MLSASVLSYLLARGPYATIMLCPFFKNVVVKEIEARAKVARGTN
jgi:hypothetical protein